MKKTLFAILMTLWGFFTHADYIWWYMEDDEFDRTESIHLIVFGMDGELYITDVNKSSSQASLLSRTHRFSTQVYLDAYDPAAYSFQFEVLQGQLGWQHSQLYSYNDIKKYIHPNSSGWTITELFSDRALHPTFVPGQAIPEPSAAILCIIGLGLLLLKRKTNG